jgi:drug/metabolite transporter (DMT)-like permease
MLRATLIIFTAAFSVLILKMKLFRHHYFSLVVICTGLALVGASQIGSNTSEDEISGDRTTTIIGVVVLLVGQVFGALSYIFEEKFLSEYEDVHPLIIVGYEGLWGSLIMTVMLVILQFIPCSNVELCSSGVVENTWSALQELGTSPMQITFTVLLLPLVCFYNTSGTCVTAYGSAAARCTIE